MSFELVIEATNADIVGLKDSARIAEAAMPVRSTKRPLRRDVGEAWLAMMITLCVHRIGEGCGDGPGWGYLCRMMTIRALADEYVGGAIVCLEICVTQLAQAEPHTDLQTLFGARTQLDGKDFGIDGEVIPWSSQPECSP